LTKPSKKPVPDWAKEAAQEAVNTFGLGSDWHIFLEWVQNPDGLRTIAGSCKSDSVYLNATIELRNNLEPGPKAKRVILHEVGHVALGEIDRIVGGYILEAILSDDQRETLKSLYVDAQERFLQRLVRGLVPETEQGKQSP
jgi:hypothetical protein